MNPNAGLKWSAAFFGVFWTIGMVWWSGAIDTANVIITAIAGSIAGYLWYLAMRWILLRHLSPEKSSGRRFGRYPFGVLSLLICRRGDE